MTDQIAGHPERVQQLFDQKAATWSAKYAPQGRLAGRLTRLADAVGYHVGAAGQVLDLGCGTGELAVRLAETGLSVTGCDISARMIEQAAANAPRGINWVQLDTGWRTLPFDSASFDALVASSVLEYVSSPAALLRECARIIAPGAVMLYTVPNLGHPIRWAEWLATAALRIPGARTAGNAWPALERHLIYLELSRQRHTAAWWRATAARAGLTTIAEPPDVIGHSPLHLFVCTRASE